MIFPNEVNYYCAGHADQPPAGVWPARVKSKHVATIKVGRAHYAHIPSVTFLWPTDGQPKLAARFLCGSGSPAVVPVDADHCPPCPRCAEIDQYGGSTWVVYGLKGARGAYLYIGQTGNLSARLRAHRKAPWFERVTRADVLSRHADRLTALQSERDAIRTHQPELNITHNHRSVA